MEDLEDYFHRVDARRSEMEEMADRDWDTAGPWGTALLGTPIRATFARYF